MSSVEKYQPPMAELDQWAEKYAASGMFNDAKSAVQAFVKISAGAELGLTPFQSMSGVHIIQGKPVVGAGLLASLLDRDPAYDYSVEWEPSEAAPQACTVTVFKNDKERGKSRFSLEDAKRAGLSGGNWQKYPASMLFARAMSNAVRWYAPGATGTSVYVEGELGDEPTPAATPAGVTAKPRTRVTAEVIPAEHVEVEPEPSTTKAMLAGMSAHSKAELYDRTGLVRSTRLADVKARLIAAADELGLAHSDEPDPVLILGAFRQRDIEELPDDAADTFQHFADTGQDLEADPQTVLDAEALA